MSCPGLLIFGLVEKPLNMKINSTGKFLPFTFFCKMAEFGTFVLSYPITGIYFRLQIAQITHSCFYFSSIPAELLNPSMIDLEINTITDSEKIKQLREQKAWITSVSGPLSTIEEAEEKMQFVKTKPSLLKLQHTLCLQSLVLPHVKQSRELPYCGLLTFSTCMATVIFRILSCGTIEAFLNFEKAAPCWFDSPNSNQVMLLSLLPSPFIHFFFF